MDVIPLGMRLLFVVFEPQTIITNTEQFPYENKNLCTQIINPKSMNKKYMPIKTLRARTLFAAVVETQIYNTKIETKQNRTENNSDSIANKHLYMIWMLENMNAKQ